MDFEDSNMDNTQNEEQLVDTDAPGVTQRHDDNGNGGAGSSPLSRIASLTSDIFSPLLMPTYAMVIALWLTPMRILPLSVRAWATLGVFFITAVIPVISILMLIKAGRVSDMSVSERAERPTPLLIALVCYIVAGVYLWVLHAPTWLILFLVGAAVIATIELLISVRWKISAHAAAAGGLCGFVVWLGVKNALTCDAFLLLSICIFILGIVCGARLQLNHHTLLQVTMGAILGFVVLLTIQCI